MAGLQAGTGKSRTGFWIIAVLALVAAAFIVWNIAFPSGTWRYKVTVSIETPEGLKTGSAVREMHVVHTPKILPEVRSSIDVKGEAVVVDLGKRGVVYAVMGTDDYYTVFNAFPVEGATTPAGIRYYKSLKPGTIKSIDWYRRPLLVMFKDPADPKSVTSVYRTYTENLYSDKLDEIITEDRFEELFGKGVRLKDITVEMTREPVMWKIEAYFPWLHEYYGQRLDGNRFGTVNTENRFANSLSSGVFSTGDKE